MSALKEMMKEIDDQLEELKEDPQDDELDESNEEEDDSEVEIQQEENEDKPEEKTEDKTKEVVKDDAYYRKERLARRREKEAELAKPEVKVEVKPEIKDDVEPNPAEDYVAWLEWDRKQLRKSIADLQSKVDPFINETQSERAFQADINKYDTIGMSFAQKAPDYGQAVNFMAAHINFGLKNAFPNASESDIMKATKEALINKMKHFEKLGENPAECLYDEAYEAGFKPQKTVKSEDKGEEKTNKRPDMNKLAENRARNGNMVNAKGAGGAKNRNNQVLAPKEFAKLTPAEKKDYLANNS